MMLGQESFFPTDLYFGMSIGSINHLGHTLCAFRPRGVLVSQYLATPPGQGNFCVLLEVAGGDKGGILMVLGTCIFIVDEG